MIRLRIVPALVALGALLCGSASGAAAPGARAPKPKTHTITIVDAMHYEPAAVTVKPGDVVVWVNKDVVQHTATSKDGGFDSPAIAPGKTWKYVPRKKGSFAYTCRFHPGMQGTLQIK